MKDKVIKTDAEWQKILTPEQYRVLRKGGTECAFTGKYFSQHGTGVFVCAGCGLELFRSGDKFDSGTGWPSFLQPLDKSHIAEKLDNTLGMRRTELLCTRCDGHLGHVFNDGPPPAGLRYCINSAALIFIPQAPSPAREEKLETATLAAGCFWCTEAAFRMIDGVKSVEVGYTGGKTKNPTYQQVCAGQTGHAEAARVRFDPSKVPFEKILEVFWKVHDPTSLNKQGADVGTQYRSAIFYHFEKQRESAVASRDALQAQLGRTVVTEIVPAGEFFRAEDYHQDYYKSNSNAPYCQMVIAPKLEKLKH